MSKKKYTALFCAAVLAVGLTACGGSAAKYKDGTYEGKSQVYEGDEDGNGDGYGVATVTIKDNQVTDCQYLTYQTDGTLKDENYGKKNGEIANADFYNKAQKAVLACPKYAAGYVENGDLSKVDAISGATISYNEFQEAVEDALNQAKE